MVDLEARLIELTHIGRPRLSQDSGGGWYACIDLPAPPGCDAKIASDFGCATPSEAVTQMSSRLEAMRGHFRRADHVQITEEPQ